MARNHGRHRPKEGRSRHYPARPRHQHRQQLHARLRRPRDRRLRNRLLLLRPRTDLTLRTGGLAPPSLAVGFVLGGVLSSLAHYFFTLFLLESFHGSPSRTRPLSPSLRHSPGPSRRSSLLWEQAPLPPGKIARRHRPPRRTHYVLLSYRYLSCP